jgi:hypothetical protein
VSLDLIFGAHGERAEDWAASLEEALAAGPDHVSVYGLTVEPGTRLAARVRRGEVPPPDEDVMADRYEAADALLTRAGLGWYEVASFAAGPASRCRHNAGYWLGRDWWGVGPGAHSHVDGERWWNHRHPATVGGGAREGGSPAAGRELLDAERRRLERVLLEVRMVEGLDRAVLTAAGRGGAAARRRRARGGRRRAGPADAARPAARRPRRRRARGLAARAEGVAQRAIGLAAADAPEELLAELHLDVHAELAREREDGGEDRAGLLADRAVRAQVAARRPLGRGLGARVVEPPGRLRAPRARAREGADAPDDLRGERVVHRVGHEEDEVAQFDRPSAIARHASHSGHGRGSTGSP